MFASSPSFFEGGIAMTVVLKHSIASTLVLALCVIFFLESLNYPESAARLPQILIIILAFLAILMLIESIVKYRKSDTSTVIEEKNKLISKLEGAHDEVNVVAKHEPIKVKRVLIFGTMIALYIFLLELLGYFILTPLFTFTALMYLKATNVVTAILLAVGFTVIIYVLFSIFLYVPIPLGIFF